MRGFQRYFKAWDSTSLRLVLLLCAVSFFATAASAQIDLEVGQVTVTPVFNGSPISATGAACVLYARIDGTWYGLGSNCAPRTFSLGAGDHTLQLVTNYGVAVSESVNFTVSAASTTQLNVDVSSSVGIVSGQLTINAGPPPAGTYVQTNYPMYAADSVSSDGRFSFVSTAGERVADVWLSGGIVGSFPFEAQPGQESDMGLVEIVGGQVEITPVFNGSPISDTGAACILYARIDGTWYGLGSNCAPRTFSLGAGDHTLQLVTNYGVAVSESVNFTVSAASTTQLEIDVSNALGVVSGQLTVNAGPPPAGTYVQTNYPMYVQDGVSSDGRFSFVSIAGERVADVWLSGGIVGSFPFEAQPGQEIDLGPIDIATGQVTVAPVFNGSPISDTGAACILYARIDGTLYGLSTDCASRTLSLGAGAHTLQLVTNYGVAVSESVNFTVSAASTTQLNVDVSSSVGIVSGQLTINAGPPPAGTYVRTNYPMSAADSVSSDGRFSFVSTAGERVADVWLSGGIVGSFPFDALAGIEIEIGAPIGNTQPGTDVQVTATNPDGSASPVSMVFDNVLEAGTTTLATASQGPPGAEAPPQFKTGSPPTYFNVTTTAVFDGFVRMCINYSGISFNGPEGNLRLFHFKDGAWTDITETDPVTGEPIVDTTNKVICGITPSFSFFAVFEPNLPPTLSVNASSVAVDEGQPALNSGTFSDPDPGDEATLSVNVGELQVSGGSWSWSLATDDGPDQSAEVVITAVDSAGEATTASFQLMVYNTAPTALFNAPASAVPGASIDLSLSGAADASNADTVAGLHYAFDCGSGFGAPGAASSATCTASGSDQLVRGMVLDKDGGATVYSATVRGSSPPTITADQASITVEEGALAANSGSFGDPDPGDVVSLSAGVGAVVATGPNSWAWAWTAGDGPTQSGLVTVAATDAEGKSSSVSFQLNVNNMAPIIEGISGPGLLAIGSQADLVVGYSDPGAEDTHTCEFSWDDDPISPTISTVTGIPAGTGQCTDSFTFGAAGVYSVTVTVTDDDGGSAQQVYEFIVVYDPSAGFVTGGGWINSPAGAYPADSDLTGKANFGFVAKYKKGQSTPDGQTEFQFKAGDLNFHSSSYQWLVLAGSLAQFKGDGTINGSGDYGFLLTAEDGDIKPSGPEPDKFRIKIWDKSAGDTVVYDNNISAGDDIDAASPMDLGGGSIVIHK